MILFVQVIELCEFSFEEWLWSPKKKYNCSVFQCVRLLRLARGQCETPPKSHFPFSYRRFELIVCLLSLTFFLPLRCDEMRYCCSADSSVLAVKTIVWFRKAISKACVNLHEPLKKCCCTELWRNKVISHIT